MVTQGLANGLDKYDIVAVARVAGGNSRLIENLIEANISNINPWLATLEPVVLSDRNFSITAGKPMDVELGRGLSRDQRSGLTKE